jgi:hypothetical protein
MNLGTRPIRKIGVTGCGGQREKPKGCPQVTPCKLSGWQLGICVHPQT